MKPRVIPHTHSPAYVRGYIKGKVPGGRKERIVRERASGSLGVSWHQWCARERAGEKDTKQEARGRLAGWTEIWGGAGRLPPQAAPKQPALSGSRYKPPPLVEVLTLVVHRGKDVIVAEKRSKGGRISIEASRKSAPSGFEEEVQR